MFTNNILYIKIIKKNIIRNTPNFKDIAIFVVCFKIAPMKNMLHNFCTSFNYTVG